MNENTNDRDKKMAAILARVSRDIQDTESQIDDLKKDAENFGYQTDEQYIFQEKITGMDSFDKDERKSLQDLKNALINNPNIKVVFMWELSRLSRNPYYIIDQLRWFNDNKVAIYFHEEDRWTRNRLTNEEEHATTQFIFGAATTQQIEWRKIRERTKRGRDNKARKGLYVGHISDGYRVEIKGNDKTFAIDEERAEVIKSIFDMYVTKQMSTNEISRFLNEAEIPTFNALEAAKNKNNETFNQTYKKRGTNIRVEKSKTKWTGSSVAQVLKNRWYIGERQYKGDTYHIPPIIQEEVFFEAQNILKKNATNCIKKTSGIYPLRSLLICGKCGSLMYGHRVHCNSTYYCSSIETGVKCGEEGICKENIDGIVWNIICTIAFSTYIVGGNIVENLRRLFGYDKESEDTIMKEIEELSQRVVQKRTENEKLGQYIAAYAFDLKKESIELQRFYKKKLNELKRDYNLGEREIENLYFQISEKRNLLKQSGSIDVEVLKQMTNVVSNEDIRTATHIIQLLVEHITLYNFQDNYKLIAIKLKSQQNHYALYNSKKFRGKFFLLPSIYYNSKNQMFSTTRPLLFINTIKKTLNEVASDNNLNKWGIKTEEVDNYKEDPVIYEKLCDISKDLGLSVLNGQFTFRELLQYAHNECELLTIERIESMPNTDEFQKWRQQQKDFQKKYNAKKKMARMVDTKNELLKYVGHKGTMEVALELGISKSKVWRDIMNGKLIAVKVKKTWKIAPQEMKRYAQELTKTKKK